MVAATTAGTGSVTGICLATRTSQAPLPHLQRVRRGRTAPPKAITVAAITIAAIVALSSHIAPASLERTPRLSTPPPACITPRKCSTLIWTRGWTVPWTRGWTVPWTRGRTLRQGPPTRHAPPFNRARSSLASCAARLPIGPIGPAYIHMHMHMHATRLPIGPICPLGHLT